MPSGMRSLNKVFKQKKNRKAFSVEKEDQEVCGFLQRGSRGKEVSKLQRALISLGFKVTEVDGIFGDETLGRVEDFQEEAGILVDGIFGSGSLHELDKILEKNGLPKSGVQLSAPSGGLKTPSKKMRWIKCPADIFPGRGGYKSLTLRSDVATAYRELYDDVHALGGIITTAGGKRALTQKTSPSRSKKSMHYVGLAFDLALPTAMQDLDSDPYLIEDKGDRRWEVWCRTDDKSVKEITVEACEVATLSGKTVINKRKVTGRFFSFTKLAAQHGFEPIRARRSFFRGGSYTGAEWWHFQYERALDPHVSQFGEELLKVYDLDRCEKFHYWNQVKNCVFKVDWF